MPVFNITLTSSETGDTVQQTINAVTGAAARNIAQSQAPDSSYRVGGIVQLDDAVELERARQANLGRDFSASNRDLLSIDEGFGTGTSPFLNQTTTVDTTSTAQTFDEYNTNQIKNSINRGELAGLDLQEDLPNQKQEEIVTTSITNPNAEITDALAETVFDILRDIKSKIGLNPELSIDGRYQDISARYIRGRQGAGNTISDVEKKNYIQQLKTNSKSGPEFNKRNQQIVLLNDLIDKINFTSQPRQGDTSEYSNQLSGLLQSANNLGKQFIANNTNNVSPDNREYNNESYFGLAPDYSGVTFASEQRLDNLDLVIDEGTNQPKIEAVRQFQRTPFDSGDDLARNEQIVDDPGPRPAPPPDPVPPAEPAPPVEPNAEIIALQQQIQELQNQLATQATQQPAGPTTQTVGDTEFRQFLIENEDIIYVNDPELGRILSPVGNALIENYVNDKNREASEALAIRQDEIRNNQNLSELEKQIELQKARLTIEESIANIQTGADAIISQNQLNLGTAQADADRLAREAVAATQAGTSPFFGLDELDAAEQQARRQSQLAGTGGVYGALAAAGTEAVPFTAQQISQAQRGGLTVPQQLELARAGGNPYGLTSNEAIRLQNSLARGGLSPFEQIALAQANANPFGFTSGEQIGLQESLARGGLTAQEQFDLQTALARGGLSAEERLAEQRLGIAPEIFRASPQSLGALSSVLGGTANLRSALNPFLGTNFTGGTTTQTAAPMSTPTLGQYQAQTPFQQGATQASLASSGQDIEQAILGVTPQGVNTNPGGLAPFTSTLGTY